MPRETEHVFIVNGRGAFPFDMLRSDRCTPYREVDSAEIERTTRRGVNVHSVALVGRRAPTTERWRSFGWEVVSDDARQVR